MEIIECFYYFRTRIIHIWETGPMGLRPLTYCVVVCVCYMFQVGTVVDSPVDFYHSRIPKKDRKRTMVEELLADAEFRQYVHVCMSDFLPPDTRWCCSTIFAVHLLYRKHTKILSFSIGHLLFLMFHGCKMLRVDACVSFTF